MKCSEVPVKTFGHKIMTFLLILKRKVKLLCFITHVFTAESPDTCLNHGMNDKAVKVVEPASGL